MGGAAVLLLLSAGTAYAANEFTGANIVDGSLTTADIANNNLTGVDIANLSIGAADLANNSVTAPKIAANSVSSVKVVNGSLTGVDVADGSLDGNDVSALDGDLDIIDNTITTFDIATNAIDSDEVVDFGLSNEDIGVLTAEVNGDGTLAASSGGVTSFSLGTGSYEVDFGRDVSACTAVGTVGPTSDGSAQGELNVADRSGNANAVFARTHNSDGTGAALPFRLVVVC